MKRIIQSILSIGQTYTPRIELPPEVNTQDKEAQKAQRAAERKREKSLKLAAQRHGRPFLAQTIIPRVTPKSRTLREIEERTRGDHESHRVSATHAP